MLPSLSHPVVIEAQELAFEIRATRRAIIADTRLLGEASQEVLAHQQSLADLTTQLDALEEEHAELLDTARSDRTRALRQAVLLRRAELQDRRRHRDARVIVEYAAAVPRDLTARETANVDALLHAPSLFEAAVAGLPADVSREAVFQALAQMRLREAAEQLRGGLLLTGQMRTIREESLASLRRGEPLLLIGETGGAKTALAEHLSHLVAPGEPEFVSGYGDITSGQVIGSHALRAEGGATLTEFQPGPLVRAMRDGRPIILDELNAMPAEFLKRLNRILQLRPGDQFSVQENAGEALTIAPGFVILATANEPSARRYRGIEQLSAELINRFGANTFRVHYPDTGISFTDLPRENLLIASAAASDREGRIMGGVTADELLRVARAAMISQHVFTGSQEEGFRDVVSTERTIDGRAGLEETVLAPRTMVALVTKVARSAGAITMEHALNRFVQGIMHPEDRDVMALIFRGQGFDVTTQV